MKQGIGRMLQQALSHVVDVRTGARVMVPVCHEWEGGVVPVTAQRRSERAAHGEGVIRRGRLRRGVFAGRRYEQILDALAATAVVRKMPGRLYGGVPRQADRVSIRSVRYDGRIDRIRTVELQCGSCIDLKYPRF